MKFMGAMPIFSVGIFSVAFGYVGLVTATAIGGRINPELEPKSDHTFMKKDYPDDRRPRVYHKFDYPYPTVQDSERYDKDYVEDKNDDGGYWNTQMMYDGLKNKLGKETDELKEALAKLEEEKRALQAARAEEAAAEKAAKDAEKNENKAEKDHSKEDSELNKTVTDVDSGAEVVEKEVDNLEECKKQLAEARKKLKSLMEEKQKAQVEKDAGDAAEDKAEDEEISAEKREELAESMVKQKEKDRALALEAYRKEIADVKEVETQLAAAAIKLRNYRAHSEDPDGGVYPSQKGAGMVSRLSAAVLLSLGLSMLA